MPVPWLSDDDAYEHNISENKNGFYECQDCGKIATAKSKLSKTKCIDDS